MTPTSCLTNTGARRLTSCSRHEGRLGDAPHPQG
jgi:hypothetical protein